MASHKWAELGSYSGGERRSNKHQLIGLVLDGLNDLRVAVSNVGAHKTTVEVSPLVAVAEEVNADLLACSTRREGKCP